MRRALRRLLGRFRQLFGRQPEPYRARTLFSDFSLAELREIFDPAGRGTRDGERNRPPSPEQIEEELTRYFTTAVHAAASQVSHILIGLAVDVHAVSAEAVSTTFKAKMDRILSNLTVLANERPNWFHSLETGITDHTQELRDFKANEQITRPPREPESRLMLIAFVLIIVVLETLWNGALFSRNLEDGLVVALVYAASISLVNVVVAWLVGRFFVPEKNSMHLPARVVGRAATVAFIVWALTLNLTIAHYRESLALSPDKASSMAVAKVLTTPLNLIDLNDWLLFVLGFVFACLSCADGYHFGDPYPGYGSLTRAVSRVQDTFRNAREAWIERTNEYREEGIDILESAGHDLAFAARSAEYVGARQRDILARFEAYQSHAQRCLRTLVDEYRRANQAARTQPPPAYFSVDVTLPIVTLTNVTAEPFDPSVALETLETYRLQLNQSFLAAVIAPTIADFDQDRVVHVAST